MHKIDRTGELKINNEGLRVAIIAYRNNKSIDITFDDGTIVCNLNYGNFKKGKIGYPKNYSSRLREVRIMNNGLKATIVAYRKATNIDVQFENGTVTYNKNYDNFVKGKINCPLLIEYIHDYAKVTNVNINPNVSFFIDIEDLPILNDFLWQENARGYIYCKKLGKLHRLIMNAKDDEIVDHYDGNSFNNRRSNLRICTQAENSRNRKINCKNTSGYKGVHYFNRINKWQSYITYNKKRIHLGYFDTVEEAAKAYNEAATKYFGDFAKLNEIL